SGESDIWRSSLARTDQQVFHLLNGRWHHPMLDELLPFTREAVIWMPLYLFLAAFVWMNFGARGLSWIFFALVTVTLTDVITNVLIKESIFRYRPCRTPYLDQPVRFLAKNCSAASGFFSAQAANYFGVAMFVFTTFRH